MKPGQTLNVVASGVGVGKSIFWSERMNEKFEALAIKAAGREFQSFATSDLDSQEKIEKFAELIVRECANLPFKSTGEVTTIGEIAVSNMILKHFGVQE
jgi:hypothetical protein